MPKLLPMIASGALSKKFVPIPDGFYQITDLDSSAYYVEASGKIYWNYGTYGDWKQEFVGEFYKRVREREDAILLNVTKSITDVDFYLKHHTGVAEKPTNHVPDQFYLFQNCPNPFNSTTIIEFALPKSAFVTLRVYNLIGEKVATLIEEQRSAGTHRIDWDARKLTSGIYLYRMETGEFVQVKKLILMR